MKRFLCVSIILFFASLAFAEDSIGEIYTVNPVNGEIIIASPNAAKKMVMGDHLVVRTDDGKNISIIITFPMMVLAKCKIDAASLSLQSLLKPGLKVYRSASIPQLETKYYETWDQEYLDTYRKVRFIKPIPAETKDSYNYYFIVVYDPSGAIVKTTEVKNGKMTVGDYYREDRIIKKDWYNVDTGKVYRIQVYDYYPNGYTKETGDYDMISGSKKIERYDENGYSLGVTSDETAASKDQPKEGEK